MVRIVVADDHAIVREGLKQILAGQPDFEVVGEARDGHEALTRVREMEFDVLLLDMSMPGKSGVELIKQIKSEKPRLRILILTMHEEHQYAVRAIRAGASGYLTKEGASAQLVTALRKVAAGGAYISAEVAEQLALNAMPDAEGPLHASLSDREFQVFRMIAEGKSISEIAERLNLSVKTVSTHKANVLQKMNMTSQGELIRYALENNLVEKP
ncbi:MAG: response regulator transcription factor [Burkholderiales bacterium]|nr:response regulator transcription factor [Burkholderiales bacterium]